MADTPEEKQEEHSVVQEPPAYSNDDMKVPLSPAPPAQSSNSEDFPVKLYLRRTFRGAGKQKKSIDKTDVLLLSVDTSYAELNAVINRRCRALFNLPQDVGTTVLNLTTGTEAKQYGDVINFNEDNCRAALMLLKRREEKGESPCLSFTFWWTPPEERPGNVLKKKPVEKEVDGEKGKVEEAESSSKGLLGLLKRWKA